VASPGAQALPEDLSVFLSQAATRRPTGSDETVQVGPALCRLVGLNQASLGAFFRARLMEAFLPDAPEAGNLARLAESPPRTAFRANGFLLTEILKPRPRGRSNLRSGRPRPPGCAGPRWSPERR